MQRLICTSLLPELRRSDSHYFASRRECISEHLCQEVLKTSRQRAVTGCDLVTKHFYVHVQLECSGMSVTAEQSGQTLADYGRSIQLELRNRAHFQEVKSRVWKVVSGDNLGRSNLVYLVCDLLLISVCKLDLCADISHRNHLGQDWSC